MKTKKEYCLRTIHQAIRYRPVRRIIYRASWHQVKLKSHILRNILLCSIRPCHSHIHAPLQMPIKLMFVPPSERRPTHATRNILISLFLSFFSRLKQCRVTRILAMPGGVYLRLAQTVQILVMTTTVSKIRDAAMPSLFFLVVAAIVVVVVCVPLPPWWRRHLNFEKEKTAFRFRFLFRLNPNGVTTLNANCSRFFTRIACTTCRRGKKWKSKKKKIENTIRAKALPGILNQTYRCRFHRFFFFSLNICITALVGVASKNECAIACRLPRKGKIIWCKIQFCHKINTGFQRNSQSRLYGHIGLRTKSFRCYRRQFDWMTHFLFHPIRTDDSIDVTNDEEPEQEPETDHQQTAMLPVAGLVPPASLYNHAQETVYETSARLLFMAVKWAKNLPSFAELAFRDQVSDGGPHTKCRHFPNRQFSVCCRWFCWKRAGPNCFCWTRFSGVCRWIRLIVHCSLWPSTATISSATGSANRIWHWIFVHCTTRYAASNRFWSIRPNSPVSKQSFCSDQRREASKIHRQSKTCKTKLRYELTLSLSFMILMRFVSQVMLSEHCRRQFPAPNARFGRLLLMLPLLRVVNSHRIESIYFQRTIGNTPMEKVLCDMYKN